jgi:AcrR family transcriptional regulator
MATREEKKAATRKKLLEAAATLVAKQGALAASLDAIAQKAGLTKGAVYSNFTSKEDLLFALADHAALTINADDLFADDARPVGETLEVLGARMAKELRAASARTWLLTHEILNFALRNTKARREIAESWRASNRATGAWIERSAVAHGESLTLTGEEIAVVVEALGLGLAQVRAIDPQSVPDQLFPKAFRLLAG